VNCPKCGYGWSKIVDSRETPNGKRRRRECAGCGMRYNAIEIFEEDYCNIMTVVRKMKSLQKELELIP
jgi:transcriptional regulator NrdR family protein